MGSGLWESNVAERVFYTWRQILGMGENDFIKFHLGSFHSFIMLHESLK